MRDKVWKKIQIKKKKNTKQHVIIILTVYDFWPIGLNLK